MHTLPKEGTTATDGPEDGNSPFATALVAAIAQPGLEVRLMFGKVRDDVLEATNKEQEPFTYTSLGGDSIFLNPTEPVPAPAPVAVEKTEVPEGVAAAVTANPVPVGPTAVEIDAAWQAVKLSNNKQALEGFVALYEKDRLYQLYGPLVQQLLKDIDTKPVAEAVAAQPQTLAALEPPKVEGVEPPVVIEPGPKAELPKDQFKHDPVLVSAIQSELKRVACYAGRSDGKWGPNVLAATVKFNTMTEPKLTGLNPTEELLVALQETADNFCTPVIKRESTKKIVEPAPPPPTRIKKVKPAAKVVSVKPRAIERPKVVAKPAPKKIVAPPKKVAAKPRPAPQKKAAQSAPINRPKVCTSFSIGRLTATPCF